MLRGVFSLAGNVLSAFLFLLLTAGQGGSDSSLVPILEQELKRNFEALQEKADPAPYYIAYAVTEVQTESLSAEAGSLEHHSNTRVRRLDVSVRVGSRKLDNYHPVRGENPRFTGGAQLALEDNPAAIRQRLWLETDRVYRLAAQRLIKIRADKQAKVEGEDTPDDFSKEEPSVAMTPEPAPEKLPAEWSDRVRRLSATLAEGTFLLETQAVLTSQREVRHLVDTEGSRLRHGTTRLRLSLSARAKAPDGMDLALSETFDAATLAGLPGEAELQAAARRLGEQVARLASAPLVEPFVGPALLSGHAAGVFFHEIFGHRVEGHRQKDQADGQTFSHSVGSKVLPEFLSVTFDPTRRRSGETDLNGWYLYDDEGIPARRVNVVESGILKTFLMSRSPIRGVDRSNGHGRRQPGLEVVSRQSNLIVESAVKAPEPRLREMLVEEIRRQGKQHGYYFERVVGGYTQTARRGIQAFIVIPVVVYRVYADGRPDELVRGADIVGTPLTSFSKILAAGDRSEVFNGFCGAESGSVPVSAVSPALLVSEIEIQKKESSQDRPPLLPAPPRDGGGR